MSEQIRTFVAVLISDELKRKIAIVQEEFKQCAPEVKWVAEENFHVTLKFLGGTEKGLIGSISEALAKAVEGVEPFTLAVGGVGAFPSPDRPRTVWVGVSEGSNELAELAKRVETSLEKLGFAREDKPFRAHITIGRVKDGRGTKELGPALKESDSGEFGSFKVGSIAVMKSELRRGGPIYSVLQEIPLKGSEEGKDANG